MTTQQKRLFRELEVHGWRKLEEEAEDRTRDWWADEVWELESIWSPRSCRVYLTFVVDPQWEGPRAKGQGVWAVSASRTGPMQWSPVQLPLGRGWERELTAFLTGLARLRAEGPEAGGGTA
jgi:hypothetical protein